MDTHDSFLGSIKKLHSVLLLRTKIETLEKSTAFLIRRLKCHEIILQPFFSSEVTIDSKNISEKRLHVRSGKRNECGMTISAVRLRYSFVLC